MNLKSACLLLLFTLPQSVNANERFWILWERYRFTGTNCPNSINCSVARDFATRPLSPKFPETIYRMFGANGPRGFAASQQSEHPESPQICGPDQARLTIGFDPIELPQSLKIEALRGISKIHLNLRNLKSPPGYDSLFGDRLHREFVALLERAGIRVVSEEELSKVPGQLKLNLFFSFTDPDSRCDYEYSVFASLSQEVLLVRDLRIKITAGVWSFSTGSGAEGHIGNEEDAILTVADAFVRAHQQVNPK